MKQSFDLVDPGWQARVPGSKAGLCREDSEPWAGSNVLFHQITCLLLPTLLLTSYPFLFSGHKGTFPSKGLKHECIKSFKKCF